MEMTYDTDDTGHNDGDGTLHHEIRSEDGHGGDSDTRLGSAVAVGGEQSAMSVCGDARCVQAEARWTYAAPIQVNTMAEVQPMAPKKGA